MDSGACEPMVQAVQQQYAFLFAELSFRLVHCDEARQGEHCLIVLESNRARIKFEIDEGTPVTYFGTLDSPSGWANQVDGVSVWYVDNALLNFAERTASPAGAAAPAPATERSMEQLLAAGAARLRPHAAELVDAFAPDRPAGWWRDFDTYQAERLEQIRQRLKKR